MQILLHFYVDFIRLYASPDLVPLHILLLSLMMNTSALVSVRPRLIIRYRLSLFLALGFSSLMRVSMLTSLDMFAVLVLDISCFFFLFLGISTMPEA